MSSRFLQRCRAFSSRASYNETPLKSQYDAVVVGAGHNGLVAAGYLQKAGINVAVLEKRHIVGGAAVTEEIVPGFKFSRASYLLSLFRPKIVNDLRLKECGLKIFLRNPSSFTPLADSTKYLLLGLDAEPNAREIAKFSPNDAQAYDRYEELLRRFVDSLDPLVDLPPPDFSRLASGRWVERLETLASASNLFRAIRNLGKDSVELYKLMTSPAAKFLDSWFESEPLKCTLATDAVIGASLSPYSAGTGYVLLHHVSGEVDGIRNAWGFVEGGMGGLSAALAKAAETLGATIKTNAPVTSILTDDRTGAARGVLLEDGTEIRANVVLSNATPEVTFGRLVAKEALPEGFRKEISGIDYRSPVTKINVALDRLPSFATLPRPGPHLACTIHLGCETMASLHGAYLDAECGRASTVPLVEMTIPSVLDSTLAPPGKHVASLFVQYTPYAATWTDETKNAFADRVFDLIDVYAPGFTASVVGREVLTPPDLEAIFGLTGGNIFHGAMSLDQLYFARPAYRCPVKGLYLCGSGAHPGGGVMGAAGRNAALVVTGDIRRSHWRT
ncbi:pyridine nucleotide-disulfide oxidoreductase domain-containing protein 2-like [Oscarella lobularis]|uniref:pyridine nucleotide-disulfide oxidoreductase domain-containing protein 2-like n=1 Tax=Oscarella lobularis TaxID=121494 RepID=UPI00331363B0